ncbi:DUF397 domain-containing protein [Streptomyces sp. NPDC002309]
MSREESLDEGRPVWFRSSYSNGAGGECVECALTDEDTLVRDSKKVQGPAVRMTRATWIGFVQALKSGSILPG